MHHSQSPSSSSSGTVSSRQRQHLGSIWSPAHPRLDAKTDHVSSTWVIGRLLLSDEVLDPERAPTGGCAATKPCLGFAMPGTSHIPGSL